MAANGPDFHSDLDGSQVLVKPSNIQLKFHEEKHRSSQPSLGTPMLPERLCQKPQQECNAIRG